MQIKLINCDCSDLVEKLECTIIHLSKQELYKTFYNLNVPCKVADIKKLSTYLRIIKRRMHDSTYPAIYLKTQDLITQVNKIAYKDNCKCPA